MATKYAIKDERSWYINRRKPTGTFAWRPTVAQARKFPTREAAEQFIAESVVNYPLVIEEIAS